MLRAVITYCLFLFVLLTGSTGKLHALVPAVQPSAAAFYQNPSQDNFSKAEPDVQKLDVIANDDDSFTCTLWEDDNEDDSVICKKFAENQSFFISLIHTCLLNTRLYDAFPLPFCRHFSYTSSYKYLTQRVIRI